MELMGFAGYAKDLQGPPGQDGLLDQFSTWTRWKLMETQGPQGPPGQFISGNSGQLMGLTKPIMGGLIKKMDLTEHRVP